MYMTCEWKMEKLYITVCEGSTITELLGYSHFCVLDKTEGPFAAVTEIGYLNFTGVNCVNRYLLMAGFFKIQRGSTWISCVWTLCAT